MCIFCQIITKKKPANIYFEDDNIIIFQNKLTWAPIMLLIVPKKHMTQEEMYTSPIILDIAKNAIKWGNALCPDGFRVLSNFGLDGFQTVKHAHMHVVGGKYLCKYIN